jgi:hypothetical protein
MTTEHRLEGRFLAMEQEGGQQLFIGQAFGPGQQDRSAQMAEDTVHFVEPSLVDSTRRAAGALIYFLAGKIHVLSRRCRDVLGPAQQ